MQPNTNQKTGIAYGYVSANSLDPDLVDQLLFGTGTSEFIDHSENDAIEILAKDLGYDDRNDDESELNHYEWLEEHYPDQIDFLEIDERNVEGSYQGVAYASSWLGGALNFFIFESPVICDDAVECSLCVLGAGNLDQRGEGYYQCYDVPADWYAVNEE